MQHLKDNKKVPTSTFRSAWIHCRSPLFDQNDQHPSCSWVVLDCFWTWNVSSTDILFFSWNCNQFIGVVSCAKQCHRSIILPHNRRNFTLGESLVLTSLQFLFFFSFPWASLFCWLGLSQQSKVSFLAKRP